jgi:hypothetical protein
MGSVSALGVAYTAHSADVGSSWPFVTLPNLQEKAGIARHMSGALFVGISPVITREHFDAWDEYIMGRSNSWMYVLFGNEHIFSDQTCQNNAFRSLPTQ